MLGGRHCMLVVDSQGLHQLYFVTAAPSPPPPTSLPHHYHHRHRQHCSGADDWASVLHNARREICHELDTILCLFFNDIYGCSGPFTMHSGNLDTGNSLCRSLYHLKPNFNIPLFRKLPWHFFSWLGRFWPLQLFLFVSPTIEMTTVFLLHHLLETRVVFSHLSDLHRWPREMLSTGG